MSKVILIGIDGLTQSSLKRSNTRNIDRLIKRGVLINDMINELPTYSRQNWGSMLSGVSVKRLEKNRYTSKTIFYHIRNRYPMSKTVMIYNWDKMYKIVRNDSVSYTKYCKNIDDIERNVFKYISKDPKFMFIHYDSVDQIGHSYGYDTMKYDKMVEKVDLSIGRIVNSLRKLNILDNYTIIVTSDHGGVGTGHGGNSQVERRIPMIISGKRMNNYSVRVDKQLRIYDIAPTILQLLNIKTRYKLDGRSILI